MILWIFRHPAPRVDTQRSITNDEQESKVEKLVKSFPINRKRTPSNSSSDSSASGKLISSSPTVETPAASTRLDTIIHQPNTKEVVNPSPSNYSLPTNSSSRSSTNIGTCLCRTKYYHQYSS